MPSPAAEEIRHRVAIAGAVVDATTRQSLDGAVVAIAGQNLSTQTREDGSFYFLDLPVGSTYTLNVSAPRLGSRYGSKTIENVTVQSTADGRPQLDPKATVLLPPTQLVGQVKRSGTPEVAIAGAIVQLRGSTLQTTTDQTGRYTLSSLQAGTPTVQVTVKGGGAATRKITLNAGQSTTADFVITS